MISGQFDFVHIVTKMLSSVQDCRESMEGSARGKLDLAKEHPLRANTPGTAYESAAVEGGNVDECVFSDFGV